MSKERIKITPCVFLFLKKGNKILLSRRFNTGYEDGRYSFVSGHIEKNETLEEGLIREVKEEISITIKRENVSLIHVMSRDTKEGGRADFVFTACSWDGEIKNNEPNKCDGVGWFDVERLPKNIISYVSVMIDSISNNKIYGSYRDNIDK